MEIIKLLKEVERRKSAETVASIDDLLIVILSRLPIKSLLRFKSVSKHWQSLITNPRFCHLHNRTIGLMLPHDDTPKGGRLIEYVPFFDTTLIRQLEYQKDADLTEVLNSCNGLLLCVSYFGEKRRYYVCNPTTSQRSLLPQLDDDYWCICGMSLAFDPAMSPHYKVVCVRKRKNLLTQILVYPSVNGAWRVCVKSSDPFTYIKFKEGVYWNGAVHWMSFKQPLCFKIEDKVLHKMPEVPFSKDWDVIDKYYFGKSCDHLQLVRTCCTEIQFNVYEMKRDYSEWFVKYTIDLSPIVVAYPHIKRSFSSPDLSFYDFSVFCIVINGNEEETFLVLQIPAKVIRLNLVDKSFKILYNLEGDFGLPWNFGPLKFPFSTGFLYIESLCNV